MHHVLFVCAQNRLRSPTAQEVFVAWPELETASAGLDADAVVPLTAAHINWANIVFVMEPAQKVKVLKLFKSQIGQKPVICLNIPDEYTRMQPELVALLKTKVPPFL